VRLRTLLATEAIKLRRRPAILAATIGYAGFVALIAGERVMRPGTLFPEGPEGAMLIWRLLGPVPPAFCSTMLLGLVATEFYYRTERFNLLAGHTKASFFFAKAIQIIWWVPFTVFIPTAIAGAFIASRTGLPVQTLSDFLVTFPGPVLAMLGYSSLGLFFGFVFPHPGLSVGMFLLYVFLLEGFLEAALELAAVGSEASTIMLPVAAFKDVHLGGYSLAAVVSHPALFWAILLPIVAFWVFRRRPA